MVSKIKGLTLQFLPYSEIAKLDTVERIKKLLKIILDNKVIILQGRLKPEEEAKKERENIRNLDLAVKALKNCKRKEKELLIPYLQKDAFVISYELDFNKGMSTLYDEIIYGIGKSVKDNLLGKKIKSSTSILLKTYC